jgi:hypothetical protein
MTRLSTLVLSAVLAVPLVAGAATVVDTGPGPSTGGGWTLYGPQWLAAEFSIAAPTVVSNVEGWIQPIDTPGTATVAIYADGGIVPGSPLFSSSFAAIGDTSVAAWFGAGGLKWSLLPGTYWVAFEVRPGQTLFGAMPDPSASPLGAEAVRNSSTGFVYGANEDLDIGVRIQSGVAAIPEPSTYALMLAGLGFVGFVAHRRRQAHTAAA